MTLPGIADDESRITSAQLIEALRDTRARTLELVADLSETQLMGPRLQIVNPLRWEIGHLAWFQEFWVLRHLGGQPPILKQGDELYDSARVAHDTRWNLPLLERDETLAYLEQVLQRVIDQANNRSRNLTDAEGYDKEYFLNLVLLHEQMHDEAITCVFAESPIRNAEARISTLLCSTNNPHSTKSLGRFPSFSSVGQGELLYIRGMAVLPTARGHKVGELLLKQIESYATAEHYKGLCLSTTPFLAHAIRLYEQFGFSWSNEGPHDFVWDAAVYDGKDFEDFASAPNK